MTYDSRVKYLHKSILMASLLSRFLQIKRQLTLATMACLATCLAGNGQAQAQFSQADYGVTPAGEKVQQFTLKNSHGIAVSVLNYGGIITQILVPDRQGQMKNIVLGFASLDDYIRYNDTIHFGSIIGRVANRIAQGKFTLDGKTYQLEINNAPNTLHGGSHGFDTKIWDVSPIKLANGTGLQLHYLSPNGENGFPGNLTVRVRYLLLNDDTLHLQYDCSTDQKTIVNLTNHSYFNLAGEGSGSVENQTMQIAASRYTPTTETSIPTGELAPVQGTVFDLRQPVRIGQHLREQDQQLLWGHGYDHNFVLDHGGKRHPGFAARATDPISGRVLEVATTEPGLQFYTANALDGQRVGTTGSTYRQTDGFALEAEHFPDSPNQKAFPSVVLKPGKTLHSETVLHFSVQQPDQ